MNCPHCQFTTSDQGWLSDHFLSEHGLVGNTEPRGLARLDAQGITELRELILDMFDSKVWLLYEKRGNGVVLWKEWQADKERLDFCDELQRRIVARAKREAA